MERKKDDRKTEEGRGLVAVRPGQRPADVWGEATETQNENKRKLICDVLTGIPASKATKGSDSKLWGMGSLPQ